MDKQAAILGVIYYLAGTLSNHGNYKIFSFPLLLHLGRGVCNLGITVWVSFLERNPVVWCPYRASHIRNLVACRVDT